MQETLNRSNLGLLNIGDEVNLERSMKPDSLLDGHIVQGHVDQTGIVTKIEDADGSTYYTIEYDPSQGNITVEKGSVAVNGVSLTVCNSENGKFRVAIIPYTYELTNFHALKVGDKVNLEFDIIGKYIQKIAAAYLKR
jgi:riboflavin synthase